MKMLSICSAKQAFILEALKYCSPREVLIAIKIDG